MFHGVSCSGIFSGHLCYHSTCMFVCFIDALNLICFGERVSAIPVNQEKKGRNKLDESEWVREIQIALSSSSKRCRQNNGSGYISHIISCIFTFLLSFVGYRFDWEKTKKRSKSRWPGQLIVHSVDCLTTVISLISIVACNERQSAVSFVRKVKRLTHSTWSSPTPFDVKCGV